MDKQCRSIRLLLMLTIIVVMTLISVLFITHRDALTCPLCWKEGLWLVKRWVEKIIFRPKEVVCDRGRFCKSNFVQIALAIKLYASDHGGFLPDHRHWKEQTFDYLRNSRIYRCPDAPPQEIYSYCMNRQLSGKNMKEIFAPKETILLFECDANGNPIVRHHFLQFRHLCNVAFVDGHVEGLTLEEVYRKLFGKSR